MRGNPYDADSLKVRAQVAIQKSCELVRQSSRLRAQTRGLLNRCDEEIWRTDFEAVQMPPEVLWRDRKATLNWAMEAALRIMKAPMGNLQLLDPARGTLHIAVQCGFGRHFLNYFDAVGEGEAACGQALENRTRIIVEDVTESVLFRCTDALEVLLDARVRSVQSTPLIGCSGALLGILSTHWSSPMRASKRDFWQLELLVRTVANCLESREFATPSNCPSLARHLSS